jgi:hypothetical protein
MSDPYQRGILGRPDVVERCPKTNREYERGSGALSHEAQTAMFVREALIAADMPKEGEVCSQTGRKFEVGSGAHPKSMQTARFLAELSPAEKAQRQAGANALASIEPAGRA